MINPEKIPTSLVPLESWRTPLIPDDANPPISDYQKEYEGLTGVCNCSCDICDTPGRHCYKVVNGCQAR